MLPKVSILVCAYNPGSFLKESLESALNQTYSNIEVVLIDDGSTDGSIQSLPASVLGDGRLRIFRQENKGKSSALNFGLTRCVGDFVAMQDADDVSLPERVAHQLRAFEQKVDLAIVFCNHFLIVDGNRLAPVTIVLDVEESKRRILDFGMPGLDPAMMVRRDVALEFLFDETLPIVEGFDFILRVGELRPTQNIGECLYGYRVHLASITKRDPLRRTQMFVALLRKTCLRRNVSFEQRFPQYVSSDRLHRFSSPLNDTLAHCIISVKSSVVSHRRDNAMRLVLWMLRKWPFASETFKAVIFVLSPKILVRKFIPDRSSPHIREAGRP